VEEELGRLFDECDANRDGALDSVRPQPRLGPADRGLRCWRSQLPAVLLRPPRAHRLDRAWPSGEA
jgi:hypothetical protein